MYRHIERHPGIHALAIRAFRMIGSTGFTRALPFHSIGSVDLTSFPKPAEVRGGPRKISFPAPFMSHELTLELWR